MKRLAVLLVAVITAGLTIAGCAPAAPPPAPTTAPAAPAKAAEPAKAAAPAPAPPRPAEPTKAAAPAPTAAPKIAWPEKGKTMTYLVGFAPGGAADILARTVAPALEKELGVSIQIVNKPGASTLLSLSDLAKAKPDGYTIASFSQPSVAISLLDPETKTDVSRKNIQLVANIESHTNVLAIKADSPYKTMKDLIDAAKAKPKSIRWSAPGQLGTSALVGYFLEDVASVKFSFVFFDSGGEALTAVLGGHAEITALNPSVAAPQVKGGQMRAPATTGKAGTTLIEGVKPLIDQGYDVVTETSTGIAAPAGTPKEIVDILSGTVKKVLAQPELKKKIEDSGIEIAYMDPIEYAAYWDRQDVLAKKALAAVRGVQ